MHIRSQFRPFATRTLAAVFGITIASVAWAITAGHPGTPVGPGTSLPGPGSRSAAPGAASPFTVIVNPQASQPNSAGIAVPGVPVGPAAPQPAPSATTSVAPFIIIGDPGTPADRPPGGSGTRSAQPNITPVGASGSAPAGSFLVVPSQTPGAAPSVIALPGTSASAPAAPAGGPAAVAAAPFVIIPGTEVADSGLTDCEIPFNELAKQSPFCRGRADVTQNGRRCERYSPSQFPEVVAIDIGSGGCTGTLIASNWVLTAAHCFIRGTKTSEVVGASGIDYVLVPSGSQSLTVRAENAINLSAQNQRRSARRAIVFRDYGGEAATPPMNNDIALIELASPYPVTLEPAVLASLQTFAPDATIAGYGFSNADNGTVGLFNVTWPVPMKFAGGDLTFKPGDGSPHRSTACQGDSGGPVFAGRYRGCKRTDLGGEARPRFIQGTISYGRGVPDKPSTSTGDRNRDAAQACLEASEVVMQSITAKNRRDWICTTTNQQAAGC